MPGLVQGKLASTGKLERRHEAEPLVGDRPRELDPLALEFLNGCVDVVGHEVQLVAGVLIGGVCGQLGGRQGKDEPPVAGIDRREFEHVSAEGANTLGVLGEDHPVDPGDGQFRLSSMEVPDLASQLSARDCVR